VVNISIRKFGRYCQAFLSKPEWVRPPILKERRIPAVSDTIRGLVTNVVDGDTFDMNVTHVGTQNRLQYNNAERIRIAEINKPELPSLLGQRSKNHLQTKLQGKIVRCFIQARDVYGRIVAKVQILN